METSSVFQIHKVSLAFYPIIKLEQKKSLLGYCLELQLKYIPERAVNEIRLNPKDKIIRKTEFSLRCRLSCPFTAPCPVSPLRVLILIWKSTVEMSVLTG